MLMLNGKDSFWLQLEVCREYQRARCSRSDGECKFAHPPTNVEIQSNGRVTACYDSIKGRCARETCKYMHPPAHLKDQLLINGRNHLALKNALLQQHQQQNHSQPPHPHHLLQNQPHLQHHQAKHHSTPLISASQQHQLVAAAAAAAAAASASSASQSSFHRALSDASAGTHNYNHQQHHNNQLSQAASPFSKYKQNHNNINNHNSANSNASGNPKSNDSSHGFQCNSATGQLAPSIGANRQHEQQQQQAASNFLAAITSQQQLSSQYVPIPMPMATPTTAATTSSSGAIRLGQAPTLTTNGHHNDVMSAFTQLNPSNNTFDALSVANPAAAIAAAISAATSFIGNAGAGGGRYHPFGVGGGGVGAGAAGVPNGRALASAAIAANQYAAAMAAAAAAAAAHSQPHHQQNGLQAGSESAAAASAALRLAFGANCFNATLPANAAKTLHQYNQRRHDSLQTQTTGRNQSVQMSATGNRFSLPSGQSHQRNLSNSNHNHHQNQTQNHQHNALNNSTPNGRSNHNDDYDHHHLDSPSQLSAPSNTHAHQQSLSTSPATPTSSSPPISTLQSSSSSSSSSFSSSSSSSSANSSGPSSLSCRPVSNQLPPLPPDEESSKDGRQLDNEGDSNRSVADDDVEQARKCDNEQPLSNERSSLKPEESLMSDSTIGSESYKETEAETDSGSTCLISQKEAKKGRESAGKSPENVELKSDCDGNYVQQQHGQMVCFGEPDQLSATGHYPETRDLIAAPNPNDTSANMVNLIDLELGDKRARQSYDSPSESNDNPDAEAAVADQIRPGPNKRARLEPPGPIVDRHKQEHEGVAGIGLPPPVTSTSSSERRSEI